MSFYVSAVILPHKFVVHYFHALYLSAAAPIPPTHEIPQQPLHSTNYASPDINDYVNLGLAGGRGIIRKINIALWYGGVVVFLANEAV